MEDPNLIATLIPVDRFNYAENAFSGFVNNERCLRPTKGIDNEPVIDSREPTPARSLSPKDNTEIDPEGKHRLLLTFEPRPKDLTKGFAFGTDKERCDVVLASRGVRQTSGVHFHIKFDVIRGERCLVLRDSSSNGSAVSYSGQAEDEVRRHFTWILNLKKGEVDGEDKKEWEVRVHVRRLEFRIVLATHDTCPVEYDKKVDEFLEFSRTPDPPIGSSGGDSLLVKTARDWNINSNLTDLAPSQSESPRKRPVYISEGNVGKGSFGKVDRVIDVSTGAIYARKTFFDPGKRERERWLDRISREIRIMKDHPHDYIVKIVDAQDEPPPFLVMPYLQLGSLRDENSRLPLTDEETIDLLFQGLSVLEYLHSRGVAYRDLKPDNILVESRSPLHVRFTDFGLANDQPDLRTFCGTEQYAAPEIFTGGSYTTAVDIWSLGVIVLEYVYGLPTQRSQVRTGGVAAIRERGLAWCHSLVEYATDWESDRLIDLLVTGMLRMEPRGRLSAGACLRKGHELGVLYESSTRSGHATPTQTRLPASMVRNEEETLTVIVGALWDVRRAPANYDDDDDDNNDQEGRSASDRHSTTKTSTSRQLDVLGSQNNKGSPWPRKETPRAISGRSSDHVRLSPGPASPPKTRSMLFGSKRYRSPSVNSPSNPPNESPVKRRAPYHPLNLSGRNTS